MTVFGGAAGGGKTYSLLLNPLHHIANPQFSAVLFRRTYPEIMAPGGLWPESWKLYPHLGARPNESKLTWTFPSGATVLFRHLQHAKNVLQWLGAQIPFIGFDQLETFCLTPEHEVLTKRGWVPIPEVTTEDYVLSHEQDGTSKYRKVLRTHVFPFHGTLVDVYQEQGVSFTATGNHRVPVKKQGDRQSVGFVRADDLEKTIQVILRAAPVVRCDLMEPVRLPLLSGRGVCEHRTNHTEEIKVDDYLELLGWYLAEGCCQGPNAAAIFVCQKNRRSDLDALFDRLPYRYGWDKNISGGGCGAYRISSRQLYEHFRPFGNAHEKRIPRWVLERCSCRQLRIVLDAMLSGDGSRRESGGASIHLSNRGLRDDLQELCSLVGLVTACGSYMPGNVVMGRVCNVSEVFTLSISRPERRTTQVNPGVCRRVPYQGSVYCLTVDAQPIKVFLRGGYAAGAVHGGNFLIRHRGRVSYTGNSDDQFWYMLSRSRSVCGVRPYVCATANPRPGWLAALIAWWIDPMTGYPVPARAGVKRWLHRHEDVLEWGESWEDLHARFPRTVCPPGGEPDGITEKRARPKSFTFIPARLTDNQVLMRADPDYLANLQALPRVDRERLLAGNWLIGDADGEWPGEYFGSHVWFDEWPPDIKMRVMVLDPSKGTKDRTGDFSSWCMLGVDREDNLWAEFDVDNARVVEPSPNDPGRRSMVNDGLDLYRAFHPHAVGVEVNGFQEWVANALLRHAAERRLLLPLYAINSRINKQARIRTLTPYFAQGRLRVRNTPGGRVAVQQLRDFPDVAAHDDGPDSLKSAEALLDFMLQGRHDGSVGDISAVQ